MKFFELYQAITATLYPGTADGGESGSPLAAAGTQHLAETSDLPPISNTGGKLTKHEEKEEKPDIRLKLDWITFNGPAARLQEIIVVVVSHLGACDLHEWGMLNYQRHYSWPCGAKLFFSDNREDCTLSLNGDACDALGEPLVQLQLLRQLHGYGFRTTRVDPAADDYSRQVITLELVHEACEAGDFTPQRTTEPRRAMKRTAEGMQLTKNQRNVGRRGGDGGGAFYRFYDKDLESRGETKCNRCELEMTGDKAREAGRQLADCEDVEQFVQLLGKLIAGNIDFRERGTETHVDRRIRHGWWQRFIDLLGEARISITRPAAPLQAVAIAIRKQYGPSLARLLVVTKENGGDFFGILRAMILDAASMLDPRSLDGRDLRLNLTEAFNLGKCSVPI